MGAATCLREQTRKEDSSWDCTGGKGVEPTSPISWQLIILLEYQLCKSKASDKCHMQFDPNEDIFTGPADIKGEAIDKTWERLGYYYYL